jgi:uncharacterized membrane protein (UPF0127 family)
MQPINRQTLIRAWIFGVILVLGAAWRGVGQAGDLVVPRVAPRAADMLVMLPDGGTVHVELAKTEAERNFGLMERTKLAEGRGMLFIHDAPGHYGYWMYDCKIGLDIVWMDGGHHIVEISEKTPPCKGRSNTCPSYGGKETSTYVLELPVGDVQLHGLKVGQVVTFAAQ